MRQNIRKNRHKSIFRASFLGFSLPFQGFQAWHVFSDTPTPPTSIPSAASTSCFFRVFLDQSCAPLKVSPVFALVWDGVVPFLVKRSFGHWISNFLCQIEGRQVCRRSQRVIVRSATLFTGRNKQQTAVSIDWDDGCHWRLRNEVVKI